MTLPASGSIYLSQVDTELGQASTAAITLNDANVRALFGVPSGAIYMADGYGKSLLKNSAVLAGSSWFYFTPANANRTTFTEAFWVKRNSINVQGELFAFYQNANVNSQTDFLFNANNTLTIQDYNGTVAFNLTTTQTFASTSAWIHIVLVMDTTNATSTERVRLYINGTRITSFSTATYPAQNYSSQSWQNGLQTHLGSKNNNGNLNGAFADVYYIDGQALSPSAFGVLNGGIWMPSTYTGTYGTNGARLTFTNSGSLGLDASGNSHNFGISGTITQSTDNPSSNTAR